MIDFTKKFGRVLTIMRMTLRQTEVHYVLFGID